MPEWCAIDSMLFFIIFFTFGNNTAEAQHIKANPGRNNPGGSGGHSVQHNQDKPGLGHRRQRREMLDLKNIGDTKY